MRVITEDDLREKMRGMRSYQDDYALMEELIEECQEIDQLTVIKLRPMSEAVIFDYVHGFTKPDGLCYEICSDGEGKFWVTGSNTYFEEKDLFGWFPKPTYKPEQP